LRTSTDTATLAPPPLSRVTSLGPSSSLAPSGRIVTSRLMPPKLNHVRCHPVAFIRVGLRQSARTTS
jgi:hypothetical protein